MQMVRSSAPAGVWGELSVADDHSFRPFHPRCMISVWHSFAQCFLYGVWQRHGVLARWAICSERTVPRGWHGISRMWMFLLWLAACGSACECSDHIPFESVHQPNLSGWVRFR